MGTSYQTLLVVGALPQVRDSLSEAGVSGFLLPAGPERIAVLPQEDEYQYADTPKLGRMMSARYGFRCLSNLVVDSDLLILDAYDGGRLDFEYISDVSMLVDWFVDKDGNSRFRINGAETPPGSVPPAGPRGGDTERLAAFGVGEIDMHSLHTALSDDDDDAPLFAEDRHRTILQALNLAVPSLTTAHRHVQVGYLPSLTSIPPRPKGPTNSG